MAMQLAAKCQWPNTSRAFTHVQNTQHAHIHDNNTNHQSSSRNTNMLDTLLQYASVCDLFFVLSVCQIDESVARLICRDERYNENNHNQTKIFLFFTIVFAEEHENKTTKCDRCTRTSTIDSAISFTYEYNKKCTQTLATLKQYGQTDRNVRTNTQKSINHNLDSFQIPMTCEFDEFDKFLLLSKIIHIKSSKTSIEPFRAK